MNISEFKKLIKECILEVKVKQSVKSLIKESLKDVKIEKGESLHYKMEELANDVKKMYKDAEVILDDAGYYNVCSCNPHHFKIYPMTDDNFTVTYMKDNTDRIEKFNLTFSALKDFITETLKTTVGNYLQKAFLKNVENNKDKESKKEEGPEHTVKKVEVKDQVEKKEDQPDQPLKPVDKIKKQVDHSVKGEKASYKYPKQTDKKLTVKPKTTANTDTVYRLLATAADEGVTAYSANATLTVTDPV